MIALLIILGIVKAVEFRPVVAILTNPSDLVGIDPAKYSYFASSYVKWLESAGSQVVPLHWHSTYEEIDTILSQVNGILFTGGDVPFYWNDTQPGYPFNKFTDTAAYIYNKALQFAQQGRPLPIFAICQGQQLLSYIASGYFEVLSPVFEGHGVHRLIYPTSEKSTILNALDSDIIKQITTVQGPYYSQNWGVLKSTHENTVLKNAFKVTAWSQDAKGLVFIAIMEGITAPIYGTQFHPEKHQFEWRTRASRDMIYTRYSQQIVNAFMVQVKKNQNLMPEDVLIKSVIYNYQSTNMFADLTADFQEIYLFERESSSE